MYMNTTKLLPFTLFTCAGIIPTPPYVPILLPLFTLHAGAVPVLCVSIYSTTAPGAC